MDDFPPKACARNSDATKGKVKWLEDKCKGLLQEFDAKHQQAPPPILYHYTTIAGLYGILSSGSIWLTDIFSMNDTSELRYGISLARNLYEDRRPKESKLIEETFNRLSDILPQICHYLSCSFSQEGDDLGQWRAYGDDGCGYSIGFEGASLGSAFESMATDSKIFNFGNFQVGYNSKDVLRVFEQMIDYMPSIEGIHDTGADASEAFKLWQPLVAELFRWLIVFSLHFKHPAYSNEKEYRLLLLANPSLNPPLKFRPRAHELIKYREFNWRALGVIPRKIVIGPAADCDKARAFAERCLKDCGLSDVEIVPSGIPYRSCN